MDGIDARQKANGRIEVIRSIPGRTVASIRASIRVE